MQTFLAILLSLVALWLLVIMIRQARAGKVDLFSVRNFFLLGFIVFQLTSGTLTLVTGYYDAVQCSNYARTGAIYTFMAVTFLVLYMVFYRWGRPATTWASRLRSRFGTVGPGSMLLMASLFLLGAVVWRVGFALIPVFGVLAVIVAAGLAATAAGLAAWAWAPRWTNPFVAIVALVIIAGALAVVFYGEFGRRNALNIFFACLWGAHHGHWKQIGLKRARTQVVTLAAGAMLFMAAFTAGRGNIADRNLSLSDSIARLGKGDLGKGFLDMATGQAAAACSMWLIETRPDPFPYDTFHTLRYFLLHPVPRILWENKPIGLGSAMTSQSKVRDRSKEFSFGPGLMGHIANDNPWLSMVPYAFGLAFMMRFMDHRIRLHPGNPFVIIPLGVALGDLLGIARGEAGFFLARIFIMTVSAWIGVGLFGSLLRNLGVALPPPEDSEGPGVEHVPDGHDLIDPELAAEYTDRADSEKAA